MHNDWSRREDFELQSGRRDDLQVVGVGEEGKHVIGIKKTDNLKGQKEQEQEITFPYTYSKPGYSVSVKIYQTPRDGYDAFTLTYYQDGQKKRVLCNTIESALKKADDVVKLLGSKEVDVLELRSADRASYKRARELLDPLGVGIEVAAAEYAHIKRLLGDTPPTVAAEYYVRSAANLFGCEVNGWLVNSAIFLAARSANSGCAFKPVPTAVPPMASARSPGST
jgi:hypothetical protein